MKQKWIEKAALLFLSRWNKCRDLTDFQQHSLDSGITRGTYEKSKLPLLRFYSTTKKKDIVRDNELKVKRHNRRRVPSCTTCT